jgi:O-methyltransferase
VLNLLNRTFRAFGFEIARSGRVTGRTQLPPDLSDEDREIIERVAGHTMTSIDRQIALIQAVRHLARGGIRGSFVECGVWRGGSSMAAALALAQEGDTGRELYLFDTFEGMTSPLAVDKSIDGASAQALMDRDSERSTSVWAVADIEDVRHNMLSTGYPADLVRYVKGPVEATIPSQAPEAPIALLRLDTDWYESTKHELTHLFPLLCDGGVLIIDDYGHWQGARQAVDEYFAGYGRPFYLHRIDYTGRLLVKEPAPGPTPGAPCTRPPDGGRPLPG